MFSPSCGSNQDDDGAGQIALRVCLSGADISTHFFHEDSIHVRPRASGTHTTGPVLCVLLPQAVYTSGQSATRRLWVPAFAGPTAVIGRSCAFTAFSQDRMPISAADAARLLSPSLFAMLCSPSAAPRNDQIHEKGPRPMANKSRSNPVVEPDGDEMTRIIGKKFKTSDPPFLDVNLEYTTGDGVTATKTDARSPSMMPTAIKKHGSGVKMRTITRDEARMKEFA